LGRRSCGLFDRIQAAFDPEAGA
jgi:hypothetical protein